MSLTTVERDDHLEEAARARGEVANYCPCGCGKEDLDEYGYCPHLIGFTNDGKTVETVQTRYRKIKNEETGAWEQEDTHLRFVSGNKKKGHVKEVQSGDILVNPQRLQRGSDGNNEVANLWVSARVYRKEACASEEPKGKKKTA